MVVKVHYKCLIDSSRLGFYNERLHLVLRIFTLFICDCNVHTTKNTSTTIPLVEAPKLDFSKLPEKEIRLKAREPIKIEIRTSGFLLPHIHWKHDGKDLPPSDRVGLTIVVLHFIF